ncbi:MAG: FG-GAP repeat protein [Verrucomicrobiota bacterium]
MIFAVVLQSSMVAAQGDWMATSSESKRVPGAPSNFDRFGHAVELTPTLMIVSAHLRDTPVKDAGGVYLFDRATGVEQTPILLPNTGGGAAMFGEDLAASGNLLIVGAPGEDHSGDLDAGAAYVFDLTTRSLVYRLEASDADEGDVFGMSVAIDGTTAIVGAPKWEDDPANPGLDYGAVYVFDLTTGNQTARLEDASPTFSAQFGASVALTGSTAVVASIEGGSDDRGLVTLIDLGDESVIDELSSPDASTDAFGSDVATDGDLLVVGAEGDSRVQVDGGAAFIYELSSRNLIATLEPDLETVAGKFGNCVRVSGWVGVGAFNGGPNPGYSGAVYLFDREGNRVLKVRPSDGSATDRFGISFAMDVNFLMVGSDQDDDGGPNRGSVYEYPLEQVAIPVEISGSPNTELAFATLPEHSYEVYRTEDLSSWPLSPLAFIQGTTGDFETSWLDGSPPVSEKVFYRIEKP